MHPSCRTGLLILTAPVNQLIQRISPILCHAATCIRETLYVQLQPGLDHEQEPYKQSLLPVTRDVCTTITAIYAQSAVQAGQDVRVLLNNFSNRSGTPPPPRVLPREVGLVLTDCSSQGSLQALLKSWFTFPTSPDIEIIPESVWLKSRDGSDSNSVINSSLPADAKSISSDCSAVKSYGSVVLGGTFDCIHIGHKILLSESAIRAEEKITVGVTDRSMLNRKTLPELIQPLDARIASVCDFIRDVKPHILQPDSVVPISDPYGPSIVDPEMRCIVVSEETKRGGDAVNKNRQEKGLCVLDIHEIPLVEDIKHAAHEEAKISSSSQRMRLLGTLLKEPVKKGLSDTPYVIGLTGGIASGKSAVCKRLEGQGAAVIDCDKLGHKAYLPGTQGFRRVVAEFGQDVVGSDGSINRRALGAKVFQDRSRLDRLNQIIWLEIASMAWEELRALGAGGCLVCVLDAAVLLEAGWDEFCHEVWSCIIHQDEALKRILDRDRLPEEKARQRIESQLSNQERVDRSNVVLCTFWEPEVTQKQVEKAWAGLLGRLPTGEGEPKHPKL
ncbi:bifunctional coenzyme A synthase-like isoform X2 [Acanthaster planci]|nr:bifunctional coenzyme A synthase-like isoform X2 [Acanthaster planci]XP_022109198.1 bifunctional coenzyme A synthase-like isoform X2 [Acanthaster planci]XP_022109199.1 bifunctional coenzyme A synthase-like isoform X2 [Acanthaster planci]XP_022109200.1 bifunctional coenzyme A synthase-like isoform X2 [Acanthaster planci]